MLEAAGAQGDASAFAELATWYLRGTAVQRDLIRAREALRGAVRIGHVDAALLEAALVANGSGAPPDWQAARLLLNEAAKTDPVAAEHAALLDAQRLDGQGYPIEKPLVTVLCERPFVAVASGAVSRAECLHLAGVAHALLEPAVVVDPATGRSVPHPVRTSFNATIGPGQETLPVAMLNRRIAAITGTALDCGEPLQVLRYEPGQQYKLHSDALPGVSNQRSVTAISYLNDGFVGGETVFPAIPIKIRPIAGDILIFHNTTPDGKAVSHARHAGLPVAAGVKWIATRWIRQRSYDVWTAP
jgi:prolyl 4-hydroxylase